ncbi:MAG: hypothetical protein WCW64_00630 [Phycisphaerae bacterium]|jgi:hypothetical protein
MAEYKDNIIRNIGQKSRKKAAEFSSELVRAKPEDKEEILAAMEFEKWLADSCHESLGKQKLLK